MKFNYDIIYIIGQFFIVLIIGMTIYLLGKKLLQKSNVKLNKFIKLIGISYLLMLMTSTYFQFNFISSDCYQIAIEDPQVKKLAEKAMGSEIKNYYSGFGKTLYSPGKIKANGEWNLGKATFPLNFCSENRSVKVEVYMSQDSSLIWQVDSVALF